MDFELKILVPKFANTNKKFERIKFRNSNLSFTTNPIINNGRNPIKVNS